MNSPFIPAANAGPTITDVIDSAVGPLRLTSDGDALTGLYFVNGKSGSDAGGRSDPAWFGEVKAQLEAVMRWHEYDWKRIEPKLRTSIVEGISVFLSLFVWIELRSANPAVNLRLLARRNFGLGTLANILVGFAPLYPAEFVVIQIQQIVAQS